MSENKTRLQQFGGALRRRIKHPYVTGFIGVVFLVVGLDDLWEFIEAGGSALNPGVHHGAIVFGMAQALSALGSICEGLTALKDTVSD